MSESTIQNTTNEVTEVQPETVKESTRNLGRTVSPAVDIYEINQSLIVKADLPGLSNEQVEVNVDQNILTISGSPSVEEKPFSYQEFSIPGYYRQFKLGETIDQEKIEAKYAHGVLTLKLPFAEAAKPKQIQVNVG